MSQTKLKARQFRQKRIRKKVKGTAIRPRLCIFRSLNHLQVQIIDDVVGKTLVGISTQSKEFSDPKDSGNVKGARQLGKMTAKKALEKKIKDVVFDRGGFLYHGRVKAFAEAAREEGLNF